MVDATAILTAVLTGPWLWAVLIWSDAYVSAQRDEYARTHPQRSSYAYGPPPKPAPAPSLAQRARGWLVNGVYAYVLGIGIGIGCQIIMSMPWQAMP